MRWRSLLLAIAVAGSAHAEPLRDEVTAQVDAQLAVVAEARATVGAKLDGVTVARARRARAAYKLLRSGPGWLGSEERMATARRRAAARWLLARDRREVALLADETASLAAAHARLTADRRAAETAPLPPAELDRPVDGAIVRRFGAFVHERSKATLSRRGIDLECARDCDVHPVADGVVLYAGPIRGLDHGLVIDHGGWVSVVGKLDLPPVGAGARVTRGQVIGAPARRRVYLEIRVRVGAGGVPVDPEPLLAR